MEKVLNYEYGCKIIAPLKKQAVGEIDYHYYNENGEEAILVTKSLVARIDGKEYLYRENTNNRYKLKELLPDYNNGKCEKLLCEIITLQKENVAYTWDYFPFKEKAIWCSRCNFWYLNFSELIDFTDNIKEYSKAVWYGGENDEYSTLFKIIFEYDDEDDFKEESEIIRYLNNKRNTDEQFDIEIRDNIIILSEGKNLFQMRKEV